MAAGPGPQIVPDARPELPTIDPLAFLAEGGEAGRLIRDRDWSETLGPPAAWPASLKFTVSLMLRSQLAMVLLWGPDGVMIYNDAYAGFSGQRHPRLLGSKVLEGWPEVADFNAHVMNSVRTEGGTLKYRNQMLVLHRGKGPEAVWLDLDYSPVIDESGRPEGVLAIVVDTTDRVMAEERLRIAQEAGNAGTFEWYPDTGRLEASNAFRRIWGLPLDSDVTDDVLVSLIKETDRPLSAKGRDHEPNPLAYTEYRIIRSDTGEERWVARRGEAVGTPDGLGRRFVGVVMDVTDRRHAEEARQRTEARLRDLFSQMQEGFVLGEAIRDAAGRMVDFRFIEVNPAFEIHTGLPPQDAIGRTCREVIPGVPDDMMAAYAGVVDTGRSASLEVHVPALGGRWFEARAHRTAPDQFAVLFLDISTRKVAEATLTESETRFRTFAQAMPNHVWTAPANGELDWFNHQVLDYSGFTEEELRGARWGVMVHPDDMPKAAAAWQRSVETGAPYQVEFRLRRADGVYRWHIARAVPIEGVDGCRRWLGTNTDIEDQKSAVEALARLAATLEERITERTAALTEAHEALRQSQKMEAVGQLTGGIAHDFNNLLQGIVGSLDIIQKRIASGRVSDIEKFLTGAMTAANRAASLTHRLLAFSRRQPLSPKPVDASQLVGSMEDLVRRTIGETIALTVATAPGLWLTRCDPNQLESAILNLVINARDAMPDGGRITIETSNALIDDAYAARAHDVTPGEYVCIAVSDTGTGMPPDVADRAFDPFFTTKPIGQGTGLGLSMIYGFARQSEGYSKIHSTLGHGTSVKIYLPRFRGETAGEDAAPDLLQQPAAEPGETVLVIEDEEVVRGLVVEVLNDLGYRALEAATGPAGLDILQSDERIDLLVTDIGLPGLNGRQVADAARTKRPGLKVLFMTGYAENAAISSGFLEPGMSMITKPFSMEALASRVRAMIGDEPEPGVSPAG
jgi:PAS domain S-box-containing protein